MMKKQYITPVLEVIDLVSKGYVLAGEIGVHAGSGVDPDENVDEAKQNNFISVASDELPHYSPWDD